MKKLQHRTVALLTIAITFAAVFSVRAEPLFPRPQGAVNDFASVIPPNEEQRIDAICREVLQKTGTSIVIATVETVGDSDYVTYANELYADWGIGKKGEDKGVLIFLAKKERKMRIETGYGVEGILPDGLTGQVLDDYVVPFLKEGDYGKGLLNGTIALSQIIAKDAGIQLTGTVPYDSAYSPRKKRSLGSRLFSFFFFIVLFFLVIRNPMLLPFLLLGMGGRGGGGLGGGSSGGFGGGFGGFGGGLSGGGGAGRGF
jgi:uncharacterized protein